MGFIFNRKRKVSRDGTKVDVIRYQDEERQWTPPAESGVYLKEMEEHIDRVYPCQDKEPYVYHEIVSDIVHIDVNIIPPDCGRDYYVLWTSGMSDLPMTLPDGDYDKSESERAELLMYLPGDWQLGGVGEDAAQMSDEYYWPIHWLKYLARFPHQYHTWLAMGHTLPNGEEYAPLGAGTQMGGFFFLPPISLGPKYPGVEPLTCTDGTKINFLWAIPMYKEEIEFKLEEGFDTMLDLLSEKNFPRVLDPKRENYKK